MSNEVTTANFVERAKAVHGDMYDYTKVKYTNNRTEVCIICPTHGEFRQKPYSHLLGCGCPVCGGTRRMNTEDFIRKAKLIHGDKYDYYKAVYVNNPTKVCIICPEHGEFWQAPNKHLTGRGCPKCAMETRKRLKYGVATNDMLNQEHTKCYTVWDGILQRCYGRNRHSHNPSYLDCEVCEEWLIYSNFKKWFDENYVEGYEIDKDILRVDKKIYSPNTCVFIPDRLNSILNQRRNSKGVMRNRHSYAVSTTIDGEHFYIGGYQTEEEAHKAYVNLRRERIFKVASEMWSRKEIDDRTYLALSQKIACVNTGRRGIGIELMQEYYDIAVKRVKDAQAQLKLEI